MRAVVQRVLEARVRAGGKTRGVIKQGFLVYLGVEKGDGENDLEHISSKVSGLRVFEDQEGKMNLDIKEAAGSVLVVSQFTLLGDCRKGRRPSFDRAEAPERALDLYKKFIESLRAQGIAVEEGAFQEAMEVESINQGPVTMLIDSRKLF